MKLNLRKSKNLKVDKHHLVVIEKEKIHWRNVLTRVISIIHYMAKDNDAFKCKDEDHLMSYLLIVMAIFLEQLKY